MQILFVCAIVAVAAAQFPAADKQQIIDEHNALRSSIAKGTFTAKGVAMPSAANMKKAVWSTALESSAQAVANKCKFEHSGTSGVGENLYMSWSSGVNTITGKGKAASQAWAKEFQDYGWSSIYFDMNVFNSGVGHATQMAWATSNQVGCGAALCDGQKTVIVVCQYKAQGNYLNTYTYNAGAACSQCASSCDQNTKLCN